MFFFSLKKTENSRKSSFPLRRSRSHLSFFLFLVIDFFFFHRYTRIPLKCVSLFLFFLPTKMEILPWWIALCVLFLLLLFPWERRKKDEEYVMCSSLLCFPVFREEKNVRNKRPVYWWLFYSLNQDERGEEGKFSIWSGMGGERRMLIFSLSL